MLANTHNYSKFHLNAIATRALIDEEFKSGILNGTRAKKLEEYPLPKTLQNAVLDIKANDLTQFIFKLHEIMAVPENK